MNYGFVIDNRKCIGCHACTVACKAEHDVPLGVNRTWVKYIEKGTFPDTRRFFSVLRCNHCADAPCETICPVTALYTRDDGIVDFDPNRCIGCKACIQACPYDALYIDPNSNTAAKCNFCAHRVEVGLEPPCSVVCPEHAIIAGDMDDPDTEISHLIKLESLSVRKPEKGTQPKVFYIDGDRASLVPSETSVENSYVWSDAREPGITPREPSGNGQGTLTDETWDRVRAVMGDKADAARRVYDTGQTHQDSWGGKVSAYLWTKSIAAGCLMLAPFLGGWRDPEITDRVRLSGYVLSLIFLALTGLLLVGDLKRPDRFLWVLTRPQWRSWLTRGSYIITAAALLATLLVFATIREMHGLAFALGPPAALAAAATAVYTAFLFWQSKGRDLWQSPLLPFHLLAQALIAGLAVMLLVSLVAAPSLSVGESFLRIWLRRMLVIDVALVIMELYAIHQTEDATRAARWMVSGERLHYMLWGFFVAGRAVPLALLYLPFDPAHVTGALLALGGLAVYEHLYVRAGQSVALS